MQLKRKYLYLLIFILFLISIILIGLVYLKNNTLIHIKNSDQNITVFYKKTEYLNKLLTSWGIVTNNKNSIQKINITFTSQPQAEYVVKDIVTKETYQSLSWNETDNEYNIIINLESSYHNKLSERDLSLNANGSVVKALYYLSHSENAKSQKIPTELLKVYSDFTKIKELPFTAIFNKSK